MAILGSLHVGQTPGLKCLNLKPRAVMRARIQTVRFQLGRGRNLQSVVCSCHVGRLSPTVVRGDDLEAPHLQGNKALYDDFVEYAIDKVQQHTTITACSFQDEFGDMPALDGTTQIRNFAFESEKIRLFRVAIIDGGQSMQVLNAAIFPRPEYDLPIFCADFFSTSSRNIIVLDLNPLYDTASNQQYKQKYYSKLMSLANKYIELLPWGEKLTSESVRFFSPMVIWTKPESRDDVLGSVFNAYREYLEAYMTLMDDATASSEDEEVRSNKEAQHRYLQWRATKDPGRPVLNRLYGEQMCEHYVRNFLFNGLDYLGSKSFLDYFPEYEDGHGGICKKRSMMGKSFASRPWDKDGNLL